MTTCTCPFVQVQKPRHRAADPRVANAVGAEEAGILVDCSNLGNCGARPRVLRDLNLVPLAAELGGVVISVPKVHGDTGHRLLRALSGRLHGHNGEVGRSRMGIGSLVK